MSYHVYFIIPVQIKGEKNKWFRSKNTVCFPHTHHHHHTHMYLMALDQQVGSLSLLLHQSVMSVSPVKTQNQYITTKDSFRKHSASLLTLQEASQNGQGLDGTILILQSQLSTPEKRQQSHSISTSSLKESIFAVNQSQTKSKNNLTN